jgi:hypothetical protein
MPSLTRIRSTPLHSLPHSCFQPPCHTMPHQTTHATPLTPHCTTPHTYTNYSTPPTPTPTSTLASFPSCPAPHLAFSSLLLPSHRGAWHKATGHQPP